MRTLETLAGGAEPEQNRGTHSISNGHWLIVFVLILTFKFYPLSFYVLLLHTINSIDKDPVLVRPDTLNELIIHILPIPKLFFGKLRKAQLSA